MPRGIITTDELYREVGGPSQDPNSDTFFEKGWLSDIITRHTRSYERFIETQLASGDFGGRLEQLATARKVVVEANKYTKGLAGGLIPDDAVPYVHRASTEGGKPLDYDGNVARLSGRMNLGGPPQRMRLTERRFEMLPNETQTVTTHLVQRKRAIEDLMPEKVQEINAAIIQEARAAIASTIEMRRSFKQEAASEEE